ncbi:MAG: dihydrofolate reductase [Saprospiraceae bacterium]|nr:dihydrofolate reductase [Saprospiraceae bacterium]
MKGKVCLYIATSIDGYIAAPGDDLGFLSSVAKEGEDYGYAAFVSRVDAVVIGRKTYDWVLKHAAYPHTGVDSYVVTRTPRETSGRITFYTGDLAELVTSLKEKHSRYIYCDGGAALVNALLKLDLIDEMILSTIPVMLGAGIKLFSDGRPVQKWEVASVTPYDTGLVKVHYLREDRMST